MRPWAATVAITALAACGADSNSDQADDDPGTLRISTEVVAVVRSAVDLAVRPGDASLFVVEHDGVIVRVEPSGQRSVLDLRERFDGHATEQGLTGLEFAADGATAWTHGTDAEGSTRISEFVVEPDGTFDAGSERTVIDVGDPPGNFHNAGDLHLAPDGTLLITLGDGEATVTDADGTVLPRPDPNRVAHDPSSLRGSILRIRPTPDAPTTHEIPDDNPFAAGPARSAGGLALDGRPEVWSWGLRNPWKIDLDATGALWIGDVGNIRLEEINRVAADDSGIGGRAVDFGWSGLEGDQRVNDVPTLFDPPVAPIWTYPHDAGRCAIVGGVVYEGAAIPALRSSYVFGDFCQESLWAYDPSTGTATPILGGPDDTAMIEGMSGVRTGPDGELYVLSWFGEVHRVVPG